MKESLLNAAVQNLLSGRDDLEVAAKAVTSDTEMIETIEAFRPDAVVIDEGLLRHTGNAVALCFEICPALRAIVVHVEANTIEVRDKKTVVIKSLEDFVAAI